MDDAPAPGPADGPAVSDGAARTSRATAASMSGSAQRVLSTAAELFAAHGYDGTSLQLIADHLGVTKAAVYYHFRTKNELLLALIEPALRDLQQLLDQVAEPPRTNAQRTERLNAFIDYLIRYRGVTFLCQDAGALGEPTVRQHGHELQQRAQTLLTSEHPDDGDAITRLWGAAALQGLYAAMVSSPDAPPQWLRSELTTLGQHMIAGYRKAQKRHSTPAPTHSEG